MADLNSRILYLKFFVEDLFENVLNRNVQVWRAPRSEDLQGLYTEVPDDYKLRKEFAQSVVDTQAKYRERLDKETANIMAEMMDLTDAGRYLHLHISVAVVNENVTDSTDFLTFFATLATISEAVLNKFRNNETLMEPIVDGAVIFIMKSKLGDTTDEIFSCINKCAPIFQENYAS